MASGPETTPSPLAIARRVRRHVRERRAAGATRVKGMDIAVALGLPLDEVEAALRAMPGVKVVEEGQVRG